MERLFVLKTLSRTQRATKVKKFVGFSMKLLRCRDPSLPPLYGHAYSRPFFLRKARMRIIVFTVCDISIARALSTTLVALYLKTWFSYRDTAPRVQHFSAFHVSSG